MHRFTFVMALVGLVGCARGENERANTLPDSASASIAMDRPERPIVPLAGGDTIRLERVTLGRANLDFSAPPPQVVVTPAEPSPEPPAAASVRYHPALLGGRPIAVWTRQVIEVHRGRPPR